MEKISIVIPVYNVSKYLRRCVESILHQTYLNFEAIFVNDGSTDDSLKILEEYEDQRICIISQENQGLSGARNTGIRNATGSYITFVDSDDWIDNKYLQVMINLALQENADIVSVRERIVFDDRDVKCDFCEEYICISKNCADILFGLKVSNFAWGKLIKRELLHGYNEFFPVGRRYEDIASMYKLYDKCRRTVLVKGAYYYYFQREGSITADRKISDVTDKMTSLYEMRDYKLSKEYDYWDNYRLAKCFGAMSDLCKIKDIQEADRKKYMNEIYAYTTNLRPYLKGVKVDGNLIKIFLIKSRLADKYLRIAHS